MIDILSQEEINGLLGVENYEDDISILIRYLKESGIISGDVEHPKIEFNYTEFKRLLIKAEKSIN